MDSYKTGITVIVTADQIANSVRGDATDLFVTLLESSMQESARAVRTGESPRKMHGPWLSDLYDLDEDCWDD